MTAAATPLRRIGAVALLCGLPLLLAGLAVDNLVEAATARGLAARQEATAALIVKEVAKRQSRRLQPRDAAALFLDAGGASLARAELQERAGKLVEAAGGRVEEAQFTSTAEQEAAGTVAMEISFTIGNTGLRDLLYAVETATPLLDVVELSEKPLASQADAQAGVTPGDARRLQVELTLDGFFRRGPG